LGGLIESGDRHISLGNVASAADRATSDIGWRERAFPSAPHTVEVDQALEAAAEPLFPVRRIELVQPYGTGFREFTTPSENLHLMCSDFQYEDDAVGKAEGHDFLKFHFKISGHNLVRFAPRHEYLIESGESVIAFHPRGLLKDDCYAAGARECSLTLSCNPVALLDLMRVQPEDLPAPLCRYFATTSPDFFCQRFPLTQEMMQTIGAILRPRYDGHLRRLHVEARSLDLICMILSTLQEPASLHGPSQKLRPVDIKAIHAVREFLSVQYVAPPSIPILARRFGLNRTKLMEGFRAAFGETVFSYIQNLRMQRAKELLLDTDLPIARVAERVGYERHTSFATAFRAHYGFAPRALKRLYRQRSAVRVGESIVSKDNREGP